MKNKSPLSLKLKERLKQNSRTSHIIDTHTALFTIAKRWKQPKCLLKDSWVISVHMHTIPYAYNGLLFYLRKEGNTIDEN